MAMSFYELYEKYKRDYQLIKRESLAHGHCLRLFVYDAKDTWLFEDGFKLDVPTQKKGDTDA